MDSFTTAILRGSVKSLPCVKSLWVSTSLRSVGDWSQVKLKLAEEAALILYEASALSFGSFKLTSGLQSPYYIDLRLIPSYPEKFDRITEIYCKLIEVEVESFDKIAGIPTAGIPFATLVAFKLKKPLIYVRKELRVHGSLKTIEGLLRKEERVLLIDDVVTTGDSALKTVRAVREAEGIVDSIVVLIDREQGARELLEEAGVKLHVLMRVRELMDILSKRGLLKKEVYDVVLRYIEGGGADLRPHR